MIIVVYSQVIHPKYYKHMKKVLTKAIWADKNELVSGRLACTSSKTEILLNKIRISILILSFQVSLD
jgi:hypothetical protein